MGVPLIQVCNFTALWCLFVAVCRSQRLAAVREVRFIPTRSQSFDYRLWVVDESFAAAQQIRVLSSPLNCITVLNNECPWLSAICIKIASISFSKCRPSQGMQTRADPTRLRIVTKHLIIIIIRIVGTIRGKSCVGRLLSWEQLHENVSVACGPVCTRLWSRERHM